jgi:hypothetical protein
MARIKTRSYSSRPIEDFLDPDNFKTSLDYLDEGYAKEQYQRGYDLGVEMSTITISINDTWSAECDHVYTHSYERLGYHANTSSLYRGMLDGCAESDCTITIYRVNASGDIVKTTFSGYEYCLHCGLIVVSSEDHTCPNCNLPTERFERGANDTIILGVDSYRTDHYPTW